ncbi:helix-turn-helix domain-containing protein [Streptosporangium sp. NBC_01810]|uniref:helix-turn-helix transcriptional regulator n=1 Tax=Streptosporangium sp. NBC_01810 TaxID=2975951 RepID=UPI002DD90E1F|nr:helix-turn-helix transcriptional regulator [Streptosporangium sp. NBC_01810]WSA27136.1 helix-turn-helix domain-containing protein [Streptosporangium sp. NBC_01810]
MEGLTIEELIKQSRQAKGLTQASLADRLARASGQSTITRNEVSRWERGKRLPLAWLPWLSIVLDLPLAVLDQAVVLSRAKRLGVTPPSMNGDRLTLFSDGWTRENNDAMAAGLVAESEAMSEESALRVAHEWLIVEPPQLHEIRAGRRIGHPLIDKIETRVDHLRHLDDYVGSTDLHALVSQELEATATVAREAAYREDVGRRLLKAVGELCQLAGWVTSDAGLYGRARTYYVKGIQAAHVAGDEPTAANLLSSLSYQMANVGDPRKAAVLARTAVKGAERSSTPLTRALLLERVAWAHAKAGDSAITERALGEVDQVFGLHREGDEDPKWVYWLDRGEVDVMAGRCFTELGRPLRAEPLLIQGIDTYDATRARELSLYLSWLADAYAQAREIEQATEAASKSLNLAVKVNSARVTDRIELIRSRLRPFADTAAVRRFEDLCQSAVLSRS